MMNRRNILTGALIATTYGVFHRRSAQAAAQPFLTQSNPAGVANPQSLSLPVASTITSVTATLKDGGTVAVGTTIGATVQVGSDSVDVVITAGKKTAKATCSIAASVGEIITWFPTQTGLANVPAVNIVIALA